MKMRACDENKHYVFISYKRQNQEEVIKVVEELQNKYGVNIWIDKELESKGGTTWNSEVSSALAKNQCKCVLFFMSEYSMMSGPVLAELYYSHYSEKIKRRKPEGLKIIPICLSPDLEKYGLGSWIRDIISECEEADKAILDSDIEAWKAVNLPKKYIEGSDAITERYEIAATIRELIFNKSDTLTHIKPDAEAIYKNIREYDGIINEEYKANDNSKNTVEEEKQSGMIGNNADKSSDMSAENSGRVDIAQIANISLENHNIELDWDNIDEFSDFDVDAEDVDTDFGENVDEDIFSQHTQEKKKFSLTGDIKYTFYGQQYEENQSDMMLRVFAQVLLRHEEVVATLPKQAGMNCAMRYEDIVAPNTKEAKPSYFRVCKEFKFSNGESVCIGTAFSSGDKMKKIARLLEICEEDSDIFQSEQVQIPATPKTRKGSSAITYRLFGCTESGDQTEMMCNICKLLIDKHPDKLDKLAENTSCITMNRKEAIEKSYFRVSRAYFSNNREYIIGTAFNMATKLKEIEKVFSICGEDINDLQIEGFEFEKKEKQTRGRKKAEKNFFE